MSAELSSDEFIECDTCRSKPGMPYLCSGCLHNRSLIERLTREHKVDIASTSDHQTSEKQIEELNWYDPLEKYDPSEQVLVQIECDPESGMSFREPWDHSREVWVSREVLERWKNAKKAWGAICEEMYDYMKKAGGRGW